MNPRSRAGAGGQTPAQEATTSGPRNTRVQSIDALRGLVMFAMIFVNDLAGASEKIVPWWMRHFKADGNGMTFVDLVFPAFLFIVGLSIPLALGSRLRKGESVWRILGHVVGRAVSLLLIGILMVNESPDAGAMGWSPALWSCLMYGCVILAFSSFSAGSLAGAGAKGAVIQRLLRGAGFVGLALLTLVFRGEGGRRIVTFAPFSVHTSWYGILGLIGWAYLVASVVYLVFRERRTALLGCTMLLYGLYVAERTGAFEGFWLGRYVGIGSTLGSLPAITLAGVLLGTILATPDTTTLTARSRFAVLFVATCAAGAWLLHGLYGINKNAATPSWCLWASAITAALWLVFHVICDTRLTRFIGGSLAFAGSNVLLAYLLSNLLPSLIDLVGAGAAYGRLAEPALANAVLRSAAAAAIILTLAAGINRAGLRLRL